MPDKVGQADIRGIDIDKLAKGFADEEFVFKSDLTVNSTSAREIRWYQKTAGVLTGATTTGVTANYISNAGALGKPTQVNPSWTRNTSYVREYIADSDMISDADIRDSDPDVIATTVRDVTRAVASQVDSRIFNVVTQNLSGQGTINFVRVAGTGWGDATNGNPIGDMLSGSMLIRQDGYDISDLTLWLTPLGYKHLLNYLITVKGSSVPAFSSEQLKKNVLTRIMQFNIRVSQNVTANYGVIVTPGRSATWKAFSPITAVKIEEPLRGTMIRVREEGECILTDPGSVALLSGIHTA